MLFRLIPRIKMIVWILWKFGRRNTLGIEFFIINDNFISFFSVITITIGIDFWIFVLMLKICTLRHCFYELESTCTQ